jgi:glyoxylase-like metal-dependent hydrolase (beta-lactamase superfamily II)
MSSQVAEISSGIHRIGLGFVNVFLVEEGDDLFLVDAGFPTDAEAILAAIG